MTPKMDINMAYWGNTGGMFYCVHIRRVGFPLCIYIYIIIIILYYIE